MSNGFARYRRLVPLVYREQCFTKGKRCVAEETPISLTYDGTAYAVMMASPCDLEDFAVGFAYCEEIIETVGDIDSLDIIEVENGIEARMWLSPTQSKRHFGRRRRILGPSGCGLCGAESIAEAVKKVPVVENTLRVTPADLFAGMERLAAGQNLNATTRAVHAAGLLTASGMLVREDVGRHNGLDKVIGAAKRSGVLASGSIVFLTSRVSVELVQKAARFGASIIAAVSAPTGLAITLAEEAGITIVAVLRADGFEVFTHPERVLHETNAHVLV